MGTGKELEISFQKSRTLLAIDLVVFMRILNGCSWPTAAIRVVENYAYCIAAFDVGAAIPLTQIRIAACDPKRQSRDDHARPRRRGGNYQNRLWQTRHAAQALFDDFVVSKLQNIKQ